MSTMQLRQPSTAPRLPRQSARRPAVSGPLDLAHRLPALVAADAAPGLAYGARANGPAGRSIGVRGHAKHCPVCRRAIGHYFAFGRARRRNARCPGCGSLERHRFLWLYLERTLRLPARRLSILHIAPESGIRDRLAGLPQLRYASIDLYRPDASLAMDVTRLGFRNERFDLAICSHVLEHVPDDRTALAEIARVLRPGGRALVAVPLDLERPFTCETPEPTTAARRLALFGHPYHVRICGADYAGRIAEAGFAVRRIDSAAILSPHRRRYHRINKTSLFDCRRI
jgi:SAM-dependent methyltransferase